jgi:uncharacterized protein (TIGR00266 family)
MDDEQLGQVWYVEVDDKPRGPFSSAQIAKALKAGRLQPETLVFGPGRTRWEPIAWTPGLFGLAQPAAPPPADLPRATFHATRMAYEIDFRIVGEEMQFVEVELDPGEAVVAEAGSMMYMDAVVEMETIFGDGASQGGGLVDSLVGAGKRLLTGESLFMTVFTNRGQGKRHVAFAAPYPGKILPMNLAEMGGEIVCQKDAFLCAAKGVSVDIALQKRIGVGLFGGEGFIMQRLTGDGLAFVHAGGTVVSRELAAGETLKVDTGCLVALAPGVDYDIQYVGSIKSAVFGGEGFFYARLSGPGTVWLQSLPFSRLAGRMLMNAPQGGGKSAGEGSLLGEVGRLFQR